jgi:hypothetical protein
VVTTRCESERRDANMLLKLVEAGDRSTARIVRAGVKME